MLKHYQAGNTLFWAVVLFVLPLPLLWSLYWTLPAVYADLLMPTQLGVLAYTWMLASIYLATRPKWLDRLVGLPTLYTGHGLIGLGALGFAYLHTRWADSSDWIKLTGDWAFDLFLGLVAYSLVFLAGWLTSRVPAVAMVKKWLAPLFGHELSVWVHRLNLVATGLVFIHVQLIDYITALPVFMALLWLYSGVTGLAYAHFVYQTHLRRPTSHVVAVTPLAPNVVALTIQLPTRHAPIAAGDYVFIALPDVVELQEPHPFSVASGPDAAGQVTLMIRGDGDFTRHIQRVRVKTSVRVLGGYGRFEPFVQEHPEGPVVMISGGIGVTPLLALIAGHPERQLTLYYSAKTDSAMLGRTQLAAWTKRPNFTAHLRVGRFTPAFFDTALTPTVLTTGVFLLSGPAALGRTWRRYLKRRGVAAWRIYYEEFAW